MTRFAADIVADLRRRILAGDLRPGHDIPSAKDIMAEWDATMATAYKAMTLLREEGLAAKHRGPGLIVTADAPAVAAAWQPPPAHGDVTRARIVNAAIELADADGLGNLSLRLIGQRAGGLVTGTFYKWVQDRAELEVLMADAVFAKHPPPKPAGGWRVQLERLSRLQWRLYRQHPWLALTVSFADPSLSANVAAHLAWAERALTDRPDAAPLAAAVANFVRGSAMHLEQEDRKARKAEAEADAPLFEFGLKHLLDGF
ncbi:GntR family transcriptional regulator [Dactylosporangium sp. NPDC049140]|uniref:GntR family transcriptional regulator n=1 Tax=Dactylosporangium sp. NPDC049140 TaxID=3155647 RepID=UPI003406E705